MAPLNYVDVTVCFETAAYSPVCTGSEHASHFTGLFCINTLAKANAAL